MTIIKFVRGGLLVLLTLLVVPLITVNVETLAEAKGWDILLSESFDPAMTILYSIVDSSWFWAGFWFVSGATAGTWFTYFFSREKSPPREASVTKPSDGQNNHVQPLDSWRNVDEYKLWQVACLWVGREPEAHIPDGHSAYPILEMLKTAVTNYKLLSVEDSKPGIFMYVAGDRKDDVNISTIVNRGNILNYISNHKDKPKWDFGSNDSESEPKRESSRISMTETVVKAYEANEGTIVAEWSAANNDVEGWFATALTKNGDVRIYGRKPPSRIHRGIPNDIVQKYFFENNANNLVNHFDADDKYTDLEIDRSDFESRLQVIKGWNGNG